MGTPAADESSGSVSDNPLVAAWSTGVATARKPFKRHGNWACLALATCVAAATSSLSMTLLAFCIGYWLAVCD